MLDGTVGGSVGGSAEDELTGLCVYSEVWLGFGLIAVVVAVVSAVDGVVVGAVVVSSLS